MPNSYASAGKGGGPHPFTNAFASPKVDSLRYNTAQYGSPVTHVYGTQRITVNVIDGFGFSKSGSGGGGGKSGGKGGASKSSKKGGPQYSVNVAFAVCQGPVAFTGSPHGFSGSNRVWSNGGVAGSNAVGLNYYVGNDGQSSDPVFLSSSAETPVLGYSGTAVVTGTPMQLGSSPALPNLQFEVTGFGVGNAGGSFPADTRPDYIVIDALTNDRYGADFPIAHLDCAGGFGLGGSLADWGVYCQAAGLAMSYVMDRQQPMARWIEEIVEQTTSAIFWSGTRLKIVPYADTAISGYGASWTPVLTAQYTLTDTDLIDFGGGSDPVVVTRDDPSQKPNWLGYEFDDGENYAYNKKSDAVFSQNDIDIYGLNPAPPWQATGFTNQTTAKAAAQIRLDRILSIRNTYKFRLGWRYSLLEPMDIVALSDTALGISANAVRIIAIEEDDNGELTITAEDLSGAATVVYPVQTGSGTPLYDPGIAPGSTNPPIIFEPPPSLSGGQLEAWIIATGGPDWGGCEVWISTDGSTYARAGTIIAGARQGTLTATLPSHADPDSSNTLAVDLSMSQGQLLSGTLADADNFVTLCYVGGELISYETATLTSSYHYNLTYLRRGAYGTPIASHAAGAAFARVAGNEPAFRYSYPSNFIGQTIYVKLPAFNIFGQQFEDLAGLTASTYTLTGAGATASFNVPIQFLGIPQSGSPIVRYTFGESVALPAGLSGSVCTAGAAATSSTVFNIAKNGSNIGTMTFAAAAANATFSLASPVSFVAGDVLTIIPTSTDATLSNLSGYLYGTS
jgi:hypothetical protein